jgi:small-conductance mechanosensitive channel
VPVRTSRGTLSELTRRIQKRLEEANIPIGSTTTEVTLYHGDDAGER